MSSLEEKLKRISGELQAYKPLDDEPRPEHKASCIHDITEYNLEETSGGLLSYADEDAVRMICRDDFAEDWDITRAAFIDTETTGLSGGSGTVAFLIGLGYVSGEKFVVEQFFMEDYDVEGEMLSRLCKKLAGFDWLVTFNGKCFDTPLIASRAVINRISAPLEDMEQVDLLHAARRIYKKRLRQCNLQNLEREVLGHEREHDVPGSLVPIMFFEYLRSGDFEPMKLVLEHNRRDIVSLLTLLCRLCYAVKEPETLGHADDIYSCGRLNERMGRLDEAEKCYQLAGLDSGVGAKELSLLLRRQGRHAEASALWLQMCASGQYGLFPYLELAKYYEHQDKDPQIALDIVEECVVKLRSMGFSPESDEYKSLARRRDRLMAKLDEKEK
jgi:uncharacterized protein